MNPAWQRTIAAGAALALCACAAPGPAPQVSAAAPPQWQAPLPHDGKLAELANWWRAQGDPLLAQLIEAAQEVSPSLAAAGSRIAQARAERVANGAALLPALDGAASVGRSSQQSALPLGTTAQAAVQASWEIDLFGAGRAARDASQARLDGAQALWHDARVALAAEVANQYYALRACQQLAAIARQDAASRSDTARLAELMAQAGLQAPASAALAGASAAEGDSRAIAQGAACDNDVKILVALSAVPEPALRDQLAAGAAVAPPALAVSALPAQTLSQRPDLFNAEREVAAASYDVGAARAQRYPRLSLTGAVGLAAFRSAGSTTRLDTWSIGPLALTVPLFDAGRRAANSEAAVARYEEAVLRYRASARQAVSEVEQALVGLDSAARREADAQTALAGYRAAFVATEQRYKFGLASLPELEDARRTRLAAENGVVTLERERSAAIVALYRAAGGGWSAPAAAAQ
jgi:outer membrane protein, multidrug efflux system